MAGNDSEDDKAIEPPPLVRMPTRKPPPPEDIPSSSAAQNDILNALIGAGRSDELLPIPPFEYALQEDFEKCLKPRQAIERFPLKTELAITQLQRELSVRRVVAIADQAVWRDKGGGWQAHSRFLAGFGGAT